LKLATWNVNSITARLPLVTKWLTEAQPDVLCLQEIKCTDDRFPANEFAALGYESTVFGQRTYNGVAILSHAKCRDVQRGFPDDGAEAQARLLAGTIDGVRIVNVYIPNGQAVGTDKYAFKLDWMRRLREFFDAHYQTSQQVLLCGDFNVAPEDRDVWDPGKFVGATHVTPAERDAVTQLEKWGTEDVFRHFYGDADGLFSYWDYRAGDFHEHRGMRIDLVLATTPLAARARWAVVDRNARKGKQPSDHAPVITDFDERS